MGNKDFLNKQTSGKLLAGRFEFILYYGKYKTNYKQKYFE